MNATHLHLLINHLAVIGASLGIVVLIFAVFSNTTNTYYAAYTVIIISAIGGLIAYFTGESAEETVERIAGVAESAIEPHEDSAQLTVISFSISAALSLVGVLVIQVRNNLQRTIGIIVLATSFISFSLAARTAWLGGQIRHTEISGSSSQSQPASESDDDD